MIPATEILVQATAIAMIQTPTPILPLPTAGLPTAVMGVLTTTVAVPPLPAGQPIMHQRVVWFPALRTPEPEIVVRELDTLLMVMLLAVG